MIRDIYKRSNAEITPLAIHYENSSCMTDPMTGFRSFQSAFADGRIVPRPCALSSDLYILEDNADGVYRLTYARITGGDVIATISYIVGEPFNSATCFGIGYSVDPVHRNKGVGNVPVQRECLKEADFFPLKC